MITKFTYPERAPNSSLPINYKKLKPFSPEEALMILRHHDPQYRRSIASKSTTHPLIVGMLSHDEEPEVKHASVANPNIPDSTIHEHVTCIVSGKNDDPLKYFSLVESMIFNGNLGKHAIFRLADYCIRHLRIYRKNIQNHKYRVIRVENVLCTACIHGNLSADNLSRLEIVHGPITHEFLVLNLSCPTSLLVRIVTKTSDEGVVNSIFGLPNTNIWVLEQAHAQAKRIGNQKLASRIEEEINRFYSFDDEEWEDGF